MSQDLMGAVVKPGAAAGAEWKQAPVPQVGPDDIPIQVKAASICGTDLHIHPWDEWAGRRIRFPQTVGHQTAGEVVEVVKAVSYRARVPGPHSPAAACRSGDAFRVRSGSI